MSQSRERWLTEMTEILGVDPEDVLEVAAMFFDAIDERLGAMKQAYEEGDIQELTRLIHGLKGDAANIGFKETSSLARRLESQCRDGAVEDFAGQFEALQKAVAVQRHTIGLDDTEHGSSGGNAPL
ncbi:MAG: Hpt domain-containing protein [Proteobacteria bacterium]|nr:Hpt domain-containing protein [Pseudomonadota bacterium]